MRSTADVKARLQEMGISPKKAFGQNFLINQAVIGKIVEEVRTREFASLVEIGPGLGALTEPMLEAGMRPRLIELDPDLISYWRGREMDVIDADALKLDWNQLGLKAPALLVSNLPYQISTSIVVDRCFDPVELKWMVLMFQKEVAERLTAKIRTKDYGLLSVMAQLHFKMRKVADLAPADFFPAPKVASRVLAFERLEPQGLGPGFLKFLKAAFAFRRKFLLKNLKGVVDKTTMARLPEIFAGQGLKETARAEELAPEQFERLYKAVYG
jgi:16S rRNA (adenine1518-N6/adenine1519-N6)-dimethyltransferase